MLSIVALRRGEWSALGWPIAIGALLADLPIFGFYFYQRFIAGAPERIIWSTMYFQPEWQLFFDLFNSIPIAGILLLLAWTINSAAMMAFAASWLLHLALDLPLHNDDAHRHFLPMSGFRFESPVSYWDPGHHGSVGAGLEIALLAASAGVISRCTTSVGVRVVLACLVLAQVSLYVALYVLGARPF